MGAQRTGGYLSGSTEIASALLRLILDALIEMPGTERIRQWGYFATIFAGKARLRDFWQLRCSMVRLNFLGCYETIRVLENRNCTGSGDRPEKSSRNSSERRATLEGFRAALESDTGSAEYRCPLKNLRAVDDDVMGPRDLPDLPSGFAWYCPESRALHLAGPGSWLPSATVVTIASRDLA
jgi:hypothetical protein